MFAFGLVAFGFLGMGPVTIAVDSYGPVTDNAQSVYELSLIENVPNVKEADQEGLRLRARLREGQAFLEENDGAGNTFKATAKPVLIGTAVVGATTMIFSIIVLLTHGLTQGLDKPLAAARARSCSGLITGGAVIYWFTRRLDAGGLHRRLPGGGVHQGEHQARGRGEGLGRRQQEGRRDLHPVRPEGHVQHLPGVFFSTLAFACVEPFFFIGYLISIALFGLYQAIFMANAGGAWDNAKKLVETELKAKGTELHAATVVGDTVGDPFKDTSSWR